MKYIYWSPVDFIIFPDSLQHLVVAFERRASGAPQSAGFVRINDGELEVYGESTSLSLTSIPAHGRRMAAFLNRGEC